MLASYLRSLLGAAIAIAAIRKPIEINLAVIVFLLILLHFIKFGKK